MTSEQQGDTDTSSKPSGRRVYIPLSHSPRHRDDLRREIADIAPYEMVQGIPEQGEPLLMVVSSASALLSASDLAQGHDIVDWLWKCPESVAQRAEHQHPTVYGIPTVAEVESAAALGPVSSETTDLIAMSEHLFDFPQVFT